MSEKPLISLVAAMAKGRVIGKDNKMPWHLPADLAHFKKITLGKPVVMGRKTFESIGRPLPGRRNVIISREKNKIIEHAECVTSLESAFSLLSEEPEIMIIGGATIYQQALEMADKLYLTYIDLNCEGDAFFPAFDEKRFEIKSQEAHEPDEKNSLAYQFLCLERARSSVVQSGAKDLLG
jgi:dihydrofolate reductase